MRGTERDGRDRDRDRPSVWSDRPIGTPQRSAIAGIAPQVHRLGRRRVGARALEQGDLGGAAVARRRDGLVDLVVGGHPGRHDQRPAGRGRSVRMSGRSTSSNEAILKAGTSIAARKSTAVGSNGAEKQSIPSVVGDRLELGLPLPRHVGRLVQVVEGRALPERTVARDGTPAHRCRW